VSVFFTRVSRLRLRLSGSDSPLGLISAAQLAFHQDDNPIRQGIPWSLNRARKCVIHCHSRTSSSLIFPLEFRIASSGMAWRGEDAENVVAMSSGDIKWVRWLRVARGFQLRVGMKDRRKEVFDGFERDVSPYARL
jgi:hypothetical protein